MIDDTTRPALDAPLAELEADAQAGTDRMAERGRFGLMSRAQLREIRKPRPKT